MSSLTHVTVRAHRQDAKEDSQSHRQEESQPHHRRDSLPASKSKNQNFPTDASHTMSLSLVTVNTPHTDSTQHSTEMDDSTHAGSTHKCCRPRPVTPLCFTVTGMDTGTPCVESSLHQINRSTGAAGRREDSGRGKHTHSIMQCTRAHIVPKSGSHRRSRPTNKKFRQCIRGNPVESFEEQRRWVSKV